MNPLKLVFRPFMRGPSCEDVNRFLCEYMEGTLPEKTRAKFQAHLSNCSACISYFEQYKATVEMVNEQKAISVPDQLVERTLDFLKANIRRN